MQDTISASRQLMKGSLFNNLTYGLTAASSADEADAPKAPTPASNKVHPATPHVHAADLPPTSPGFARGLTCRKR